MIMFFKHRGILRETKRYLRRVDSIVTSITLEENKITINTTDGVYCIRSHVAKMKYYLPPEKYTWVHSRFDIMGLTIQKRPQWEYILYFNDEKVDSGSNVKELKIRLGNLFNDPRYYSVLYNKKE